MIKVCTICGKTYEGRFNSKVCSFECKAEAKRRYQVQYKKDNKEAIKYYNARWYAKSHGGPMPTRERKNMDTISLKQQKGKKVRIPDIYRFSKWGRKYYQAERLDRIVMLSTALYEYGIERLTYGYLSAMYENGRYMTLLYKVLKIKDEEGA